MIEEIKDELNKGNLKSSKIYVGRAKTMSSKVDSYLSKAKNSMFDAMKTNGNDQAIDKISNINKERNYKLDVITDLAEQAINNFDK